MTSKSEWAVQPISAGGERRLFFDEHQWVTIEAATARIIPTDHDPGAREAKVVRFLDRYLSGPDYVFAAADGSGFLRLEGREREAWAARIERIGKQYAEGVRRLDELAGAAHDRDFTELGDEEQDGVLEALSGAPKPGPLRPGRHEHAPASAMEPVWDGGLPFFDLLVLHTRQGFYCDPVYGGNEGRVGWKLVGFPGPESLADTQTGRYTTDEYLLWDMEWPYVVADTR